MSTFVGRADQLSFLARALEEIRTTGEGRMISVRGRRQIGKSRLIEEFIRRSGVPAVFYTASRQSAHRELELFNDAVAASATEAAAIAREGSLGSWEAALTLLGSEASQERPLIVVVDELPYLIEADETPWAIEGTIQKVWDRRLERRPIMLILVGSDLSTMAALSEYDRPLYNRPRELVVPPLSPAELADMLALDAAAALDAYLVIGGFPRLAALWRRGESIWRFLARELGDASSPLLVIGERSLNAEFPADLHARAVLSAIGSGERAFKTIGGRSGIKEPSLALVLPRLEAKGLIARVTPYSARQGSKLPRYHVTDPYLRFWLRFLGPAVEAVERGRGDVVIDRIREGWNDYRGHAIEPIVRRSIERMLPDERFGDARFVGGYWTRDGRVEIDLVGGRELDRSDTIDFVGSVKWRERAPFAGGDLASLLARRNEVPGAGGGTTTVGVSRSGFDAAGLDVEIGPDELVSAWREGG